MRLVHRVQQWSLHNSPSVLLPSIDELSSGMLSPRHGVLSVARIDFAQMIEAAGAYSIVEAMIDHFDINEAAIGDIITCSGPFFLRAHQHWMDRPGGVDELNKLVRSGGPQQFADRPELVKASVSQQEGQVYLNYLFLGDKVLGMVTQRIASRLDMEPQKLKEMMPSLAALFVGVLCKSMTS